MILFIQNAPNRQIHRDRKQICGCLGPGTGNAGGNDENVMGLDSSVGCTTL